MPSHLVSSTQFQGNIYDPATGLSPSGGIQPAGFTTTYDPTTGLTTSRGVSQGGSPYPTIGSSIATYGGSGGGFEFPAFRKLTPEEKALITAQKNIADTLNATMQEQLDQAKFYNSFIRDVTPTSEADRQTLLALNRSQVELSTEQIRVQRAFIVQGLKMFPKYDAAREQQLDLFEANMSLMALQNETALTTEPARRQLLATQIETQIKAVTESANTVALQGQITGINSGPLLDFVKQNLSYQQIIDQNQFGNIMTKQQIEGRQLDIFSNQLDPNAAFADRQLEVASRAQGLTETQIDFALEQAGLERMKLGVEAGQLGTTAELRRKQAELLSGELGIGVTELETKLSGLGQVQIDEITRAISGDTSLSPGLKIKEDEEVQRLVEAGQREGLKITGTTLDTLQGTGSSSAIDRVSQFKRRAQARRDDERRAVISQLQTGLGGTLAGLAGVKGQRVSLATVGLGTEEIQARAVTTPQVGAANIARPDVIDPTAGIGGLSQVSLLDAPQTNLTAPTFTTGAVSKPVIGSGNIYDPSKSDFLKKLSGLG